MNALHHCFTRNGFGNGMLKRERRDDDNGFVKCGRENKKLFRNAQHMKALQKPPTIRWRRKELW